MPTDEERARVSIALRSVKDALDKPDPAREAARTARQAEIDAKRAAAEEHDRRMEYIMHGFEPVMFNGKTMSIALARATGARLIPRIKPPVPKCEFSPEFDQ